MKIEACTFTHVPRYVRIYMHVSRNGFRNWIRGQFLKNLSLGVALSSSTARPRLARLRKM
jgi:predicted PurR-regulated permease PerM